MQYENADMFNLKRRQTYSKTTTQLTHLQASSILCLESQSSLVSTKGMLRVSQGNHLKGINYLRLFSCSFVILFCGGRRGKPLTLQIFVIHKYAPKV